MKIISKNISEKDLKIGLQIYNYFIANSFSNFEEKELAYKNFLNLYKKIKSNKLPFVLAKKNKEIIGIASVIFLIIDVIWLSFATKSFYRPLIGNLLADKPVMWAAALFLYFICFWNVINSNSTLH